MHHSISEIRFRFGGPVPVVFYFFRLKKKIPSGPKKSSIPDPLGLGGVDLPINPEGLDHGGFEDGFVRNGTQPWWHRHLGTKETKTKPVFKQFKRVRPAILAILCVYLVHVFYQHDSAAGF